jgi:poly(A) polymerase
MGNGFIFYCDNIHRLEALAVKVLFRDICPVQLFHVEMVLDSLSDNNYLVGGSVRDILIGKVPKDWDIVTDTPMDVLIKEFKKSGMGVKQTGVAHFVLNVYHGGMEFEISNFRKDVVCNGRQAEVEIGTIGDDANRRDFTVNALYVHLKTQEVLDPTGQGIHDIDSNILRFVGKPKDRIREDFLRVFRFYRFLSKGFTPEKKSLKAVREMFSEAYDRTTPERVRMELEKMVGV